jgi:hypothetical protein
MTWLAMDNIIPLTYAAGLIRIIGWILGVYWLARSVIKPDPAEHLRWYARTIRAIGVLILGSLVLFGVPRWLGWVK